ncbi:hypothetical protein [Aurantimonas sp. 22II-16-19i]|uniref:hypothetical protein n=1 Tax=Aurantimonas sp. 22II-16-19i TaxID=1317114 RepID=UPI0009F7F8C5|nr:hypothetical protein [Aurantimonas sp. 22II-16-19i]ORE93258.1 hypothetical protein ATO4_15945 [Aurantimonas sp. 22II-16-19i]
MTIIPLHLIRSGRPALRCKPVQPEESEPAEAGLVIPTPPVLLIAYALHAHRSGRLDVATADRLIRRLLASGDAAAQVVACFLLARQHRLPDASPPASRPAAMIGNSQSLNSSTDRRST